MKNYKGRRWLVIRANRVIIKVEGVWLLRPMENDINSLAIGANEELY